MQLKVATFTSAVHARCVFSFHTKNSATTVQHNFCTRYSKDPLSRPQIYSRYQNLVDVQHDKSPDHLRVSDAVMEQVRESLACSPTKSTRCLSRKTGIPQPTVWHMLHKYLHLKPYRFTMVQQQITDADMVAHKEFLLCKNVELDKI